jgi:glycosyltransferase involved in cell wall biosynthesis
MHHRIRFDGILAFDVSAVGGIAWRLGRLFGIPASGWVTGKTPAASLKVIKQALKNLDMVFYQSHELLDHAACLLGVAPSAIPGDQHIVLPRGIPVPPPLPKDAVRQRIRREWGIRDDHVLVLSIGRISREKGSFEFLHAVALAATRNPRITGVIIGSSPDFDETTAVQKTLDGSPELRHKIKLLPACPPDKVWEYLCAADIFAFTSHHEGMPNSLLEAMSMGVPAIAFAIPPVVELEAGSGGLLLVPPLNAVSFAAAIVHLAAAPDDRLRMGERGKNQVMQRFMVRKNLAIALERLCQITAMKYAGKNFSSSSLDDD